MSHVLSKSDYPLLCLPEDIVAALKSAPALIGLDRDGTLIPYADRPENAVADDGLRILLQSLCELPETYVAIVSARSLQQLQIDFGSLPNIILAGNYGLEIQYPGGEPLISVAAQAIRPQLRAAVREVAAISATISHCILEDHGLSACLHFHAIPAEQLNKVHELAALIQADPAFKQIRVMRQPTSYEFLPALSHGKGDALLAIEKSLLGSNQERPVFFAGDTEGDESAFAFVNQRGGVSVRIGTAQEKSGAKFQLPSPTALRQCLHLLTDRFGGSF